MRKNTIVLMMICLQLAACRNQKINCDNDFENDWMKVEGIKRVLWENYRDDSVNFQIDNLETYRIRWSNSWLSTTYLTFTRTFNESYLYIEGFSRTKKKYLRQEFILNPDEWAIIKSELNRIDFWCSDYDSGNNGLHMIDGTNYLLEGMRDKKFHVTRWQIDKRKEPFLDKVLEIVKSRLRSDLYRTNVKGDSIILDFSIDSDVKEVSIIVERDTVNIDAFGRLEKRIARKDSLEIEDWILLEKYRDKLQKKIPLAKLELYFPRQDISEEEARKMVEESKR